MKALTPKQEAFCQEYALHGNASRAYRNSYDTTPETKAITCAVNGCKLLKDPKIKARIKELREELNDNIVVTANSLLEEFEEARQHALADPKGAAAATAASNAKAKLLGFMIDKHEHTGKDGGPIESKTVLDVSGMSEEELAILAKALERK